MARRDPVRLPSVRLPHVTVPKEPPGWNRTEVAIRTRLPTYAHPFREQRPAGDPPRGWLLAHPNGTVPEWSVYWALTRLGRVEDIDFLYQPRLPGVGMSYYSTVDFLLPAEHLALEISGSYWHYATSQRQHRDRERLAWFAREGITVIFIDEDDALYRPIWVVEEALAGRDHSKLARRF